MDQALNILVARLLAHRFLPRKDPLARRALIDEAFRESLDHRLAGCGMRLLENPYAEYIAVGLAAEMEDWVLVRAKTGFLIIWACRATPLPC